MSIGQSSMSGSTRGRSFTGLFAPPKCAASGRVIQAGCQLWIIKIIGSPTRPCSGWPLPFTAHSPRGSAWCSTSRKAETMLGRSFSGRTARGPRRRGAGGKGRRESMEIDVRSSWGGQILCNYLGKRKEWTKLAHCPSYEYSNDIFDAYAF